MEENNYKDKFSSLNEKEDVIGNELYNKQVKTDDILNVNEHFESNEKADSDKYDLLNRDDNHYGYTDNNPDKYKPIGNGPDDPGTTVIGYGYTPPMEQRVYMGANGQQQIAYAQPPSYMYAGLAKNPPNDPPEKNDIDMSYNDNVDNNVEKYKKMIGEEINHKMPGEYADNENQMKM